MLRCWFLLALVLTLALSADRSAVAQLTPTHRKELAELTKQVGQAAALIRKKEYDAAEAELTEVTASLKKISTAAGLSETDPAIKKISTLVEKQRELLAKASGKAGPAAGGSGMSGAAAAKSDDASFVNDVAPIIDAKCLNCHGANNPRAGLRLDTFAGWVAGGRSGALLAPGNPTVSLIIARVNAPEGKGQMPPNNNALNDEEKAKFAEWVRKGAKFDGANPSMTLKDLMYEEAKKRVQIPKPKGTETVSFTRDIAPWMATLCLNCHNSRQKRGDYSMETFFDIMKGGESGEVIIPGDHEGSRLFRLTGGLENPRMPNNQSRLTRKNYEDMKKWFQEGNTFDGNDPRTPITEYVPSELDMAKNKFGSKSDAEMRELRTERTSTQAQEAGLRGAGQPLTSETFLILGDADKSRLQTVQSWAQPLVGELQKTFGGSGQPWRGGLAIFVLKDRDGYEQFVSGVESKRASSEAFGHARVTLGHEDAYIVLQDTGDSPARGPGLRESLIEQLTVAYLQRGDRPVPLLLAVGAGYVMAEGIAGPDRVSTWKQEAALLAPAVNSPDDVFVDGTFSPASTGAIGYTLVKFMQSQGGAPKFEQFLRNLEKGETVPVAIKSTYGVDSAAVAKGFFASLKAR